MILMVGIYDYIVIITENLGHSVHALIAIFCKLGHHEATKILINEKCPKFLKIYGTHNFATLLMVKTNKFKLLAVVFTFISLSVVSSVFL